MTEQPTTAEQFADAIEELFDQLGPTETDTPANHGDTAADLLAAIEADSRRDHR